MLPITELVPGYNVALLVLDSLRYDVAMEQLERGNTPTLQALMDGGKWERRTTHGTYTFPAHWAMFTGFLPRPETGAANRPFVLERPDALPIIGSGGVQVGLSEKKARGDSLILGGATIVEGLALLGYKTVCIGGVQFFNKREPVGNILPGLFQESYWEPETGYGNYASAEREIEIAKVALAQHKNDRLFFFMNFSATHRPTTQFVDGATEESRETQGAALAHIDRALPELLKAMRAHGHWVVFVCSDHGTLHGERGVTGHMVADEIVMTVPYLEAVLE